MHNTIRIFIYGKIELQYRPIHLNLLIKKHIEYNGSYIGHDQTIIKKHERSMNETLLPSTALL
jgi:hypothetical protein